MGIGRFNISLHDRLLEKSIIYLLVIATAFVGVPIAPVYADPVRIGEIQDPEEFAKRVESAEDLFELIESEGRGPEHELDPFRLISQWVFSISRLQKVRDSRVSFRLFDEVNASELSEVPFDGSTAPNSVQTRQENENQTRLEILYRGEVTNVFLKDVKGFIQFGSDLVFIDKRDNGSYRLNLLDLDAFKDSIGRSQIPVFEMPFEFQDLPEALEVQNGELKVGENIFKAKDLAFFKRAKHVALNVTASLSTPKGLENAQVLIDEFDTTFDQALEETTADIAIEFQNMERLSSGATTLKEELHQHLEARRNAGTESSKESLRSFLKERGYSDRSIESYESLMGTEGLLEEIQAASTTEKRSKRKLVRAAQMVWSYVSAPRKNAAKDLLSAIGFTAQGFLRGDTRLIKDSGANFLKNSWFKRGGTALLLGALAGFAAPEASVHFLHSVLSGVSAAGANVAEMAQGLKYLVTENTKATFAFAHDYTSLLNAYVFNGKGSKTLVGLTALGSIVFSLVMFPLMFSNTLGLYKDMKKANWDYLTQEENGRWGAFKRFLISRQKRLVEERLATNSPGKSTPEEIDGRFTADEQAALQAKVQDLDDRFSLKAWKRLKDKLADWGLVKRRGDSTRKEISNFRQALTHFMFGAPAWIFFTQATVTTKQMWYGAFSFVWRPALYPVLLSFPKFYSSIIKQDETNVSPSQFNGGLKAFGSSFLARRDAKKLNDEYGELLRQTLADESALEGIKEWESQVFEVEQVVENETFQKSLEQLIRFSRSHGIAGVLENREGLNSVVTSSTEGLARSEKTFFRIYKGRIHQYVMERLVERWLESNDISTEAQADLSLSQKKLLTLNEIRKFEADPEEIKELVKEAQEQPFLFDEVSAIATGDQGAWERFRTDYLGYVSERLNPANNRQAAVMKVVERQRKNPAAVERATFSMITSNLVSKPIMLLMMFLTLAGVQGDLLVPIQDEFMGENSFFYLSRNVFAFGFLYSVFRGIINHAWYKLQKDDVNEGNFGRELTEEEKNMSYRQFLFSRFKEHEDSYSKTWWKNHKHLLNMSYSNMLPTLTNFLTIGILTMGRFDLDEYINGYLLLYGTPLEGGYGVTEQAFELSTDYFSKDFTQKELRHPDVQDMINKVTQRQRIKFNIYYKTLSYLIWNFEANFTALKTSLYGSRTLSRIFTDGHTYTHLVTDGVLRPIRDALMGVPGVKPLVNACIHALENNFTAGRKGGG